MRTQSLAELTFFAFHADLTRRIEYVETCLAKDAAKPKPSNTASLRVLVKPLFLIPWLLYVAALVWYPVHESTVARERVAAADFARCQQHAASVPAVRFCQGDYERDLEDAREIHWEHHPLWTPFWFAPLTLLLPPFMVFGLVWIMTRGSD